MIQNSRNKCNLLIFFVFILTSVVAHGYVQDGNSVIYQIDSTMLPQIAFSNAPQYGVQAATQYNNPAAMPQFAVAQFVRPEPMVASNNDIEQNEDYFNRAEYYQSPSPTARPQIMNDANRNVATRKPCVKCPSEITSIARQGLDGILVEPPAPVSCATNLPFSRDLYQIETLFGSKFFFVLPHGRHLLFAKIRNMGTGMIEHTCPLRYNVVVKRCPKYAQKNPDLQMFCSTGAIWGSSCTFGCRPPNSQLSHQEPIICNENSEWIGQEPSCVQVVATKPPDDTDVVHIRSQRLVASKGENCRVPDPPVNGRYSCEINTESDDYQLLASGSVCNINCNQFYSIPRQLRRFGVIQCIRGAWNATNMNVCQPQQQQKRLLQQQQHLFLLDQRQQMRQRKLTQLPQNRPDKRRHIPFTPRRVKISYN